MKRSGGQILVEQLKLHGVDTMYGVPGESFLAVLDALHDHSNAMRFVICRQEGGAAMMADAYGKTTGRPGICMVTRGPGATNASAGVHVAYQDSTPMILLIGQVGRDMMEREAFQEVDYRRMFGQMAKWVAQIDDAARIPEFMARAFSVAMSGRRGPVVLALPEDMLTDVVECADGRPIQPAEAHPGPAQMAQLKTMLEASERPLMIVGGSGWSEAVRGQVQAWAEASAVPVAAVFRRQDYLDNDWAGYVGDVGIGINPKLQQRLKEADLLLVMGSKLGEMATGGYTMIDIPVPGQAIVHVHAGAEELNRVYSADLAINASNAAFAAALAAMGPVKGKVAGRAAAVKQARAEYEAWQQPGISPGPVQMGAIIQWLDANLPADAVFTNGAGNYATWVHRFHRYRRHSSQLAPTSGSMGYGVPAAVAAKLLNPDRTVVAFAGDGCFLMTGQEFATAVQYGAGIIVVVVNNGMYGTIRMHQEREYPERVSGTTLVNPDFAAYARAFGGHGETVERTEDFAEAFRRAQASGKPAIIEVKLDPEALTPRASLSDIRAAGIKAKAHHSDR
ncbi:thiamine pyrophosphate-binding protein [Ferrovibrio sp.]|uniref:thiamine pyrophosphate-binding protein n=1 Tax=Ferrovibrio sp. TaxID=1917215 RepID=UPI00311E90C5